MLLGLNLTDAETASSLLRAGDGNVRAALLCWSMALGAFVILRIPRPVLLACLIAAGVTVGLAVKMAEIVPMEVVTRPLASGMMAARGHARVPGEKTRPIASAD